MTMVNSQHDSLMVPRSLFTYRGATHLLRFTGVELLKRTLYLKTKKRPSSNYGAGTKVKYMMTNEQWTIILICIHSLQVPMDNWSNI